MGECLCVSRFAGVLRAPHTNEARHEILKLAYQIYFFAAEGHRNEIVALEYIFHPQLVCHRT